MSVRRKAPPEKEEAMAMPDGSNSKTAAQVVTLLHEIRGARGAIDWADFDRLDAVERARVWEIAAVKLADGLHLPADRYGVPIDLVVEPQRLGLILTIFCADETLRS